MIFMMWILISHCRAILDENSCPDLPNYVPSLPGLGTQNEICNYAGYLEDTPFFYWFVVKKKYTHLCDVPLILYLGTGTESALVHLFLSPGPYRFIKDTGKLNITRSLSDFANILVVEQPGIFSFSQKKYSEFVSTEVLVNDLDNFLDIFITKNGLQGMRELFIHSEGLIAKVGTQLSNKIHFHKGKYAIKGMLMENSIPDLSSHFPAIIDLIGTLGIIPKEILIILREESYMTSDFIKNNPELAYQQYQDLLSLTELISGQPNIRYNIADTSQTPKFQVIEEFLSRTDVQEALHITEEIEWKATPHSLLLLPILPAIVNSSSFEHDYVPLLWYRIGLLTFLKLILELCEI